MPDDQECEALIEKVAENISVQDVWVDWGKASERLRVRWRAMAVAALAVREEPRGKNDLEVSRLLLQVATERERTAQALAERNEALTERDKAEGNQATLSDELVERVAKAIFEAGRGPHRVRSGDRDTPQFPWEKVPATPKTGYRMQARAAIAVVVAAREEPQGEEHVKRVDPALPLLCPECKRFGGISDEGATFLISMEDGCCELCGWKAQDHVRA